MQVQDYPNYLIHRDGRVQNKKTERFLKPQKYKTGYSFIALSKNKKQKFFLLHRLIAIHYIPNPDNLPIVDHKNQKNTDNRIENLRWCTHSQNSRNCKMQKNNTSGFTGISKEFSKKCKQGYFYRFHVCIDGKQKWIKSSVNYDKLVEFATKWKEDNNYIF